MTNETPIQTHLKGEANCIGAKEKMDDPHTSTLEQTPSEEKQDVPLLTRQKVITLATISRQSDFAVVAARLIPAEGERYVFIDTHQHKAGEGNTIKELIDWLRPEDVAADILKGTPLENLPRAPKGFVTILVCGQNTITAMTRSLDRKPDTDIVEFLEGVSTKARYQMLQALFSPQGPSIATSDEFSKGGHGILTCVKNFNIVGLHINDVTSIDFVKGTVHHVIAVDEEKE